MSDGKKKIEVEELRISYGSKEVVHGISFDVYANEILGIIGPAQSGKTSLLRCLNRTIDFSPQAAVSGRIRVDGEDVRRVRNIYQLRRKIGMVAPLPVGLPLSIYDNVTYGLALHGLGTRTERREIADRCLAAVGLKDDLRGRLDASALTLSAEQAQRLCIARAIAVEPDVVLMDEPCSTLDPIATLRIETLMRELAQRYTVLVVTHNMQQASRISDDTGFMLLGELVEMGPTADLFTRPRDRRTEDYVTGRYG